MAGADKPRDVKGFGVFDQDDFEDPSLFFFDETEYEEKEFSFNHGNLKQKALGWSQGGIPAKVFTHSLCNPALTLVPLPGGCQYMWPGSFGMCEFIARNGASIFDTHHSRVAELGSGSGVLGLVASHFAKEVTLTDGDKREVLLLRENASRFVSSSASVSAKHLPWGWKEAEASGLAQGCMDVVIGAEICYVPDCIPLLVETIDFLLSPSPSSAAYIGNCCVSSDSSQAECRALLDAALASRALLAEDLPFTEYFLDSSNNRGKQPSTYLIRITRKQAT